MPPVLSGLSAEARLPSCQYIRGHDLGVQGAAKAVLFISRHTCILSLKQERFGRSSGFGSGFRKRLPDTGAVQATEKHGGIEGNQPSASALRTRRSPN